MIAKNDVEHTAKGLTKIKHKIIAMTLAVSILIIIGIDYVYQKNLTTEQEIISEAAEMLAEGYLTEWIEEEFFVHWTDKPGWVTLLQINPEYALCYINRFRQTEETRVSVSGCVVRNIATGQVSSVLDWDGQVFARDLGSEEYGLILESGMIVFDRATLRPLRLEPTPALVPSDFADPAYLKEWRLREEIDKDKEIYMIDSRADQIGAYQLCYIARYSGSALDSEITYMLYNRNGEKQSYTPLITLPKGYIRTGYLFDGRFAIIGERGWALTLDPETCEPISLHWNLEETGSELWQPLASTAYGESQVTVGYLLSPELYNKTAVCIYGPNGAVLSNYIIDLWYDIPEKQYKIKIPELQVYGDHLIFSGTDHHHYSIPVSISLLDGTYETAEDMSQLFLGQEYATTVTKTGNNELNFTYFLQVWKDGNRYKSYSITIPNELLPDGIWDIVISDAVYDEENHQVHLYSTADRYTVDINTMGITVTECLPIEPEYVIGTTEGGRYTVAYVTLSPNYAPYFRVYRIDNDTGETRTLYEESFFGDEKLTIIDNQLSVSNKNTIFYDLETCELLPFSLPYIEGGIHDVVFDEETGWYIRATSPAVQNYDTETLTTRIDCYDKDGNYVCGWDTGCKPNFGKYAMAYSINLTVYYGEALFYDFTNEPRSLARLNLSTGEVLITGVRDFAVSNGYLYTAEFITRQQITMRKYVGDTLVEEKTTTPAGDYFNDFIMNE